MSFITNRYKLLLVGKTTLADYCIRAFWIKEALLVLMVCAPVFIFTSGSSALDLLGRPRREVYWCHCRYLPYSINFSEFISFFSLRENRQNTKILEVRHFRMIRNWPPTVIGRAKHNTERASKDIMNRKLILLLFVFLSFLCRQCRANTIPMVGRCFICWHLCDNISCLCNTCVYIYTYCLFGVIIRVKVVFRKTVVGDWRFVYLSGSHLQSQVKSLRQMMVFMSLV